MRDIRKSKNVTRSHTQRLSSVLGLNHVCDVTNCDSRMAHNSPIRRDESASCFDGLRLDGRPQRWRLWLAGLLVTGSTGCKHSGINLRILLTALAVEL